MRDLTIFQDEKSNTPTAPKPAGLVVNFCLFFQKLKKNYESNSFLCMSGAGVDGIGRKKFEK